MKNYSAVLAMDDDELSQLVIDLIDYGDSVSEIFSKIDSKMQNLGNYYVGNSYNEFMKAYREFRKNYPIVKNTIVSYSDDLIALMNKVHAGDHQIAFAIENITDAITNEAKKINEL